MKCAECGNAAQFTGSWDTESWREPYRDAEGKLHHHKLIVTSSWYRCTKGHRRKTVSHKKGWCGFPENKSKKD